MNDMVARRDREAQTLEVIQTFGVGGQLLAANLLNIEDKDGKQTFYQISDKQKKNLQKYMK